MNEWQRVSPIAMVFFVVNGIPHLINLWPALVPLLAGGEAVRNFIWSYGPYLLLVFGVLGTVLPYWFFGYRVESDHLRLRSGVLHRKQLTLYFDRVQQADIAQPFYFRPFGLAVLGLESAGSSQQEVNIPGLRLSDAEALKSRILALRENAAADEASQSGNAAKEPTPEPDYELRLPWQEIAKFGLMHNGLLLFMPVLGSAMQQWLPGLEAWLRALEGTEAHQVLLSLSQQSGTVLWVLLVTLTAVAGAAGVYLLSMAIALVRYWDYHLTRHDDQYQYRAGLTTLKTRGFRRHKLQLVTLSQGIVARLLRRSSVTISKAGARSGSGGSTAYSEQRFLIPVVSPGEWQKLRQQLQLPDNPWQRVSAFWVVTKTLLWGSLAALSCGMLLWLNQLHPAPAALLVPLVALGAWRRWWCMGFYWGPQWVAVKSGFIGRTVQWLPIAKAQKISISQPPWLRPLGLANLRVWGADGAMTVPCVPIDTAEAASEFVLNQVVHFRAQWM